MPSDSKICSEKIIIFDIYENNAYTLKQALDRHYFGSPEIIIRIGSVRDKARLREVFEEFHPSSVFHAAAHKHVPLMEDSPFEAIRTTHSAHTTPPNVLTNTRSATSYFSRRTRRSTRQMSWVQPRERASL